MHITEIELHQFKNHPYLKWNTDAGIVCITGKNGIGKTNVLDAIHLLSLGRSYFHHQDQFCIQNEEEYTLVNAFLKEENDTAFLQCQISKKEKKIIRKNKAAYTRMSDHLGVMPVVMVSPKDINLLYDGSLDRRKFIDAILVQTKPQYLHALQSYQKGIEQRGSLLKKVGFNSQKDFDVLDALGAQLIPLAEEIYKTRKEFIASFSQSFSEYYAMISNSGETAKMVYESQLNDMSAKACYTDNYGREIAAQRNLFGVHKDDYLINLDEFSSKIYASQGQAKSIIIALKLAQYSYMQKVLNKNPILLLDDIFEKLDEDRSNFLMKFLADNFEGQTFITHTHEQKLKEILASPKQNVIFHNL